MDQPQQSDILSGVGITALGAAAARAVESDRPDRLIEDPFAAAFIDAARLPMAMPLHWPAEGEAVSGQQAIVVHGSNYTGLRSRYFDDYLLAAGNDGIRQVVILAAGLDARAFRLDWPPGVRLFEVDRPAMLEFKDAVLGERGAQARCAREVVAIDLRDDWPAALLAKDFVPTRPTAWLIEGLLPYLSADVELRLFERVDDLSDPESRLSAEHATDLAGMLAGGGLRTLRESAGVDMAGLVQDEPRTDLVPWLTGRGWSAADEPATAVAQRYHRDLNDPRLAQLPGTPLHFGEYLSFLTASRTGA
jgi:methyltransferase (TIGR00027 family)